MKVKRFGINHKGRDLVVGDIHGCFSMLADQLQKIGFNDQVDRLFSVGDLVDRGPESEKCLNWLDKPWFHSVRGNHEQMAIDFVSGMADSGMYLANGGAWIVMNPIQVRVQFADAFNALPTAIEVETENGLVGIVHAECPPDNWGVFVEALNESETECNMDIAAMWSRTRISQRDTTEIEGVHAVIVGHTPQQQAITLGNVHYIDTGAVFGRKLTIYDLSTLSEAIAPEIETVNEEAA